MLYFAMFGISDPLVYSGYLLTLLSLLVCLVYGLRRWNAAGKEGQEDTENGQQWDKEEESFREDL